jgi:hypothetical protein
MNWKEIKINTENIGYEYNGKLLFNRVFLEVLKFHDPGIAPVKDHSGSYHINQHGQDLYPQRYERTFGYYCKRAAIKDGMYWFHVDEKGIRTYELNFAWTGNYQENLCVVRDFDNSYFHINLDGNRIYPESFIYCGDFKDGIACAKKKNGKFIHIDCIGQHINQKEFVDLGVFHKKYAIAKDEKGWFHIDIQGNELYSKRYLIIEPFYNGFALVTQLDNNKIIIDEQGKKIITI